MILQEVEVISSVTFMTIIVKVGLCILTLLSCVCFSHLAVDYVSARLWDSREIVCGIKKKRKHEVEFLKVLSGF